MTRKQLASSQRGLGWAHQKRRARMLNALTDGTPCWWCNQPMHRDPTLNYDNAPLEADHSNARSIHGTTGNHADRLLHRRCNRQRLNGLADHLRPALTGADPRTPFNRTTGTTPTPGPHKLLTWPW